MGGKKKTGGGNGNKENEDTTTVVLKFDMHCDGCASKMFRHLRAFPGVETVTAEGGKVTVTGKVDPAKVRDSLAEKTKKKVELVSPQPKKEKEKEKEKEIKEAKPNNKPDKKTKDKEVTTVVLKMALHCQGCVDRIDKTVLKTKGVQEIAIDKEKETVTVKGTMDAKALAHNLMEKLKRKVEVLPPKNHNKDGDKKETEKEGSGKKNKGGGGNKNENNEGGEMIGYNRMEYFAPPAYGFGYGGPYAYAHPNNGGYSYLPVYPDQMHLHLHAHPPQMFSDENPNACSVM